MNLLTWKKRMNKSGSLTEETVAKIGEKIEDSDLVVDVGGGAMVCNMANYVVDFLPYEKRGQAGSYGPPNEYFTKDTWIQLDICSERLPFDDNEVDFIVCTHLLEDIRDPIGVCKELNRVAKAGYIECPSREWESIMGQDKPNVIGAPHHRWFVETKHNKIIFTLKSHLIYSDQKYYLPHSHKQKLSPEDGFAGLFWENAFEYEEPIFIHLKDLALNQEAFIKSIQNKYRRESYDLYDLFA